MALLTDAVVAVLAAMGLASALVLTVRALCPRRELAAPVYLVLPVSGDTREMEQSTAAMQLLRREYGGAARAVLLDCGMEEEQRRMARILQREDPLLELLTAETFLAALRGGR